MKAKVKAVQSRETKNFYLFEVVDKKKEVVGSIYIDLATMDDNPELDSLSVTLVREGDEGHKKLAKELKKRKDAGRDSYSKANDKKKRK